MGTADISKNYSSMQDLANTVSGLQTDFKDLKKILDDLAADLEGGWTGSAELEFDTVYSKLSPKLTVIQEALGDFATAVNAAASDQEALESASAASKSNLSF